MQIAVASWWPLLLLAAVPILWLFIRGNRAPVSGKRIRRAAWLRIAALCLIVAALMDPRLQTRTHRVSVVYALDISRSVSPDSVRQALEWMRAANARYRPARARYVVFADRPKLLDSLDDIPAVAVRAAAARPGSAGDIPGSVDADAIDQAATDLEQAINAAQFGFAPQYAKRLILISDGNETAGNVWRAVPRLRAEHVRVFALPAAVALENEAWIEAIELPDAVRQQEPVTLRVRVHARGAARARVQVAIAGEAAGVCTTLLAAGDNLLAFQVRFKRAGESAAVARLDLEEADGAARGATLSEMVWVRPRPKVLYVESNAGAAHYLADALALQGIDVRTVGPDQIDAATALRGIDVVLLSDVAADQIDAAGAHRLEAFVRDAGGGLIFAAGENTYGKAGYAKGEIERLLPIRFEGRRKRRELDLVLLIDRSYSMHGRKLEMAKAAALATLDMLEEQHRLAVVAFDSRPHDVVPLAKTGSKRRAEDLIGSMTASGQTNIYNALWHAYRMLADSHAKTKHVILLSDGDTAPPPAPRSAEGRMSDSESAWETMRESRRDAAGRPLLPAEATAAPAAGGFERLVDEMAAAEITLSTVAIGDKPKLELMRGLAKWGNGKSYVAARDVEIPGLFVAEARRLLGESLVEEPFRPIVQGRGEALAGIDFAASPPLKGYVVARAKRFSDVLLAAKKDQPLLAETRYGLGKTVAFLSDVKNHWAVDWLSWPGYGRFWAQVIRDAARDDGGQGLAWRVERRAGRAFLTLSALDDEGRYRNGLSPAVRVTAPDAHSSVVVLRQTAPGTYRAGLPLQPSPAAPYRFELLASPGLSSQEIAQAGMRGLFYARSDEYRGLPPNLRLLTALSEQTGGKLAPAPEEAFARSADGGTIATPLWPHLTALTLLLFLGDIAVRRMPWPSGANRQAKG